MEEDAERRLMSKDAAEALKNVSPAQKDVIFHRFFLNLSVKETAEAMGKNKSNIRVLQFKGIDRIRVILASRYGELFAKQAK